MLVDAPIVIMILVALYVAVRSPLWFRTAVLMLAFALFNLAIDPIMDKADYSNPWIMALFNLLCGMILLAWGSKHPKELKAFTTYIIVMFIAAAVVETLHIIDIENGTGVNETNRVYPNYRLMILVLNAMQYLYLMWGIPYGRLPGTNTDARLSGDRARVEGY